MEGRLKLKGEEETTVSGISLCPAGAQGLGEGSESCVEYKQMRRNRGPVDL